MKCKFVKMHGIGNDYIYFNCFDQVIKNPESLSVKLSDRHFGIGGDGIILIYPSDIADAKMMMYNADGSVGKMCGNGIRCVGKFLFDNNLVENGRNSVSIETLSGVKTMKVYKEQGVVTSLEVDMGKPVLSSSLIPVMSTSENIINYNLVVNGSDFKITCVSMGNPHCVVFCDDIDQLDLKVIGPYFENNDIFPERINTEFVQILNDNSFKMRVWERGSGETLACGTGACASLVAAILNGHFSENKIITAKLLGGDLFLNYTGKTVYMNGSAEVVYEGYIEIV